MEELDFNDEVVSYVPARIAPAVTSAQTKPPKKTINPRASKWRDIERKLEEKRLEAELRDLFDY